MHGAADHGNGVEDGAYQEGATAVDVVQIVHREFLIVVDNVVVHNDFLTFNIYWALARSVGVYTRLRQVLQIFENFYRIGFGCSRLGLVAGETAGALDGEIAETVGGGAHTVGDILAGCAADHGVQSVQREFLPMNDVAGFHNDFLAFVVVGVCLSDCVYTLRWKALQLL